MVTSSRRHAQLVSRIRDLEKRAVASLINSGIHIYDTTPQAAEWGAVYTQTRERLKGRVYPAESLAQLQNVLAAHRGQP